ncbi:uncharacterized protein LOC124788454 [Schistocerca piceifrons]|uniref:uncharacterized protein LOC124788454 n=1 Tax=Schistocerca piceifrons TaxID=274613 RepID=UPI001F5F75CD|nr:uncharacterized protein LOC124788454 [Schistocerca piceifrons]
MKWTDDFVIQFINTCEQYPELWDATNSQCKIKFKKSEVWDSIATDLGVDVAELKKKKKTSLLATYRKVRQMKTLIGKSCAGVEEVNAPNWFIFKGFEFLHCKYQLRKTINTDISKIYLFLEIKRAEDPRIGEAYNALQTALSKTRDEFDAYGEYIVNIIRSMDNRTRAFVKKEFSDTIFRAESACFEHSRPSSTNSNYSCSSHLPISSTQQVHAHEQMQSNFQQTFTSTSDNTEQGFPHFLDLLDL